MIAETVFDLHMDCEGTSPVGINAVVQQFLSYERGAEESWADTAQPAFPTVAARVRDMLVALERDGFVSFG